MSSENLYCAQNQPDPLAKLNATEPQPTQIPMNAKLTDSDRKAVDFFLDGEEPAMDDTSPMARNGFMDHVHAVRRLLNLLEAMPAEALPATSSKRHWPICRWGLETMPPSPRARSRQHRATKLYRIAQTAP